MSEQHAFQHTPWGIVPIGTPMPAQGEEVAPGIAHSARAVTQASQPQIARSVSTPPTPSAAKAVDAKTLLSAGAPVTGKQLMAAAKARVKELDRLLRQVPALEAERASLLRLIQAAQPTRRSRKATTQVSLTLSDDVSRQ